MTSLIKNYLGVSDLSGGPDPFNDGNKKNLTAGVKAKSEDPKLGKAEDREKPFSLFYPLIGFIG